MSREESLERHFYFLHKSLPVHKAQDLSCQAWSFATGRKLINGNVYNASKNTAGVMMPRSCGKDRLKQDTDCQWEG